MSLSPAEKESIRKRNFYFMMMEGALFWAGTAFVEPNTVVSVFINDLTGSTQLAGLAATLRLAAWYIGQFIMGVNIYRVRDHGLFLRKYAFVSRMPFWFILPPLLLGFGGTPVVLLFIFLYTSFFVLDGFIGLNWTATFSHTLSPADRGTVFGMQQAISALLGLGSATAIKLLMDSPLDPTIRYACIFGLSAIVLTMNSFLLRGIRDIPINDGPPAQRSFSRYVRNFPMMWRSNLVFRNIVYGRMLYNGGIMAAALIVLFGREHGGLTPEQASTMVYLQVLGQLCGGLLWAYIGSRFSNLIVMRSSNILALMLGGMGIAVFAAPATGSLFWACAAMVFISGVHNTSFVAFSNAMIDHMPSASLTAYIVLNSLLLMPLAFMPYVAGFLAEYISYLPVFILVCLFGICGFIQTMRLGRILPKIPRDTGVH